MRRLIVLLAFLVAACLFAVAQQSGTDASSQSKDQAQTAESSSKKEKKDKKDKKKDKKSNAQQDELNAEVFSDRVASNLLGMIRDGLEGHSQRLMLSAFDDDKMDGKLSFEDQLEAMFNKYEEFRVHFRILQTTTEGAKGVALVEITMEETPRGGTPVRKSDQMRFEMERGKKGWRIVDLRPRQFFS